MANTLTATPSDPKKGITLGDLRKLLGHATLCDVSDDADIHAIVKGSLSPNGGRVTKLTVVG